MPHPLRIAFALILCFGALRATTLPRDSAERGRIYDGWRRQLEQAESAEAAGRIDEAEPLFRAVIDAAEPVAPRHLLLARALDGLADLCREQSRWGEAAEAYTRAAGLWGTLLGEDQPRLAVTLHNLGVVQLELGRADDARANLERALAIFESAYGPASEQARNTRRAVVRAGGRVPAAR